MRITKELTLTASFTALLIGAQLVLSAVSGVEIVSVLFISYCYYFGAKRGVVLSVAFSLLRCFLFGFFPAVIILYLVYYSLLALVSGGIGALLRRGYSVKQLIVVCFTALIMTIVFTLLDNVITPLFYAFSMEVAKAYFVTSMATVIPHCCFVTASVALLFIPICKIFAIAKL